MRRSRGIVLTLRANRPGMNKPDHDGPGERMMTVAQIRDSEGTEDVEVVFLESARFYTLSRKKPQHQLILKALRTSMAKGTKIKVRFASPGSDVIEAIL